MLQEGNGSEVSIRTCSYISAKRYTAGKYISSCARAFSRMLFALHTVTGSFIRTDAYSCTRKQMSISYW